jgi:hypothetical protein
MASGSSGWRCPCAGMQQKSTCMPTMLPGRCRLVCVHLPTTWRRCIRFSLLPKQTQAG